VFQVQGLTLIGILGLLANCAAAQVDQRCAEAAALWIPSSTSVEKTVVKWGKPLKYDILSRDDSPSAESANAKQSVQKALNFYAQESGLKIELGASPDLVVVVDPDIAAAAPNMRKFVENYFQEAFASGIYKTTGQVEVDSAQWETLFRSTSPKCSGLNMFVNGVIVRAFGLIQADESAACISVALGGLFGLINIKKYYSDHDRKVPTDFIAAATRTLYDRRVIAGISQVDAEKIAAEVCK
jgi:hypothetical protein